MSDLPQQLPVPKWEQHLVPVTIDTAYGQLTCLPMGPDDVLVNGPLVYRGHTYNLDFAHTNDEGALKGYFNNGREYGVVTTSQSQARAFGPTLPPTFVEPLVTAVREAVRMYMRDHAEHAADQRRIVAVQQMVREAETYNRRAEELRGTLTSYDEAALTAGLGAWVWEQMSS